MASSEVIAEIERQHGLLESWLGSAVDDSVLKALRDAHTADFSMLTTAGEIVDREALLAGLADAAHALPGLRIRITDVVAAAGHRWRWRHVHETPDVHGRHGAAGSATKR